MATQIERWNTALTSIETSATKQDEIIDKGINEFVSTPFGNIRPISNAMNVISAINVKGDWVTPTAYTLKDLVLNSGTWYLCIVPHTSGTFATDLSAKKWTVYQFNRRCIPVSGSTYAAGIDETLFLNTGANAITVNLPDAASMMGLRYSFKKIHAANTVTIDPHGTQTIDGAATYTLKSINDVLDVVSDGVNWLIVSSITKTDIVPPGSIMAWATSVVPDGWLEANGANRLRAMYPRLFAVLGTMYGAGDGSTTFGTPDLRGRFLRGWNHSAGNDPDAAGRTDRGDGTTGDQVGTRQVDALQGHWHKSLTGGPSVSVSYYSLARTSSFTSNYISYDHLIKAPVTDGTNGTPRVSKETRPKNISVMWIIKY